MAVVKIIPKADDGELQGDGKSFALGDAQGEGGESVIDSEEAGGGWEIEEELQNDLLNLTPGVFLPEWESGQEIDEWFVLGLGESFAETGETLAGIAARAGRKLRVLIEGFAACKIGE